LGTGCRNDEKNRGGDEGRDRFHLCVCSAWEGTRIEECVEEVCGKTQERMRLTSWQAEAQRAALLHDRAYM
jgi:hypothetical protein